MRLSIKHQTWSFARNIHDQVNKYRFAFSFPYLPLKWGTKSMFMVAGTRIKTVVGSILRQREVCDRGVSSKTDLPSGVVILFNLGFVSPGWGNRQPLLTQRLTHHKHTTRIEGTIVCQRNAIVSTYFCQVSTFFFAFPSLSRFNELTCSGECDESWVTCS